MRGFSFVLLRVLVRSLPFLLPPLPLGDMCGGQLQSDRKRRSCQEMSEITWLRVERSADAVSRDLRDDMEAILCGDSLN